MDHRAAPARRLTAAGVADFDDRRLDRIAERVRELAETYAAPGFAHVPDPNAAIFLCAVDHKAGYARPHIVDGEGPLRGSELMWAVGLRSARSRPGFALHAEALAEIDAIEIAAAFAVEGDTVAGPERRAALWRDLSAGLIGYYDGSAERLLAAAGGRLGGEGGLLERLRAFAAYADPLAKKAQLFAKICARRGWLEVLDPESWDVSADSVLMRLALRSGLVAEGGVEAVRAATREAFARVAEAAALSPPVLDDMLWELGRENPDLLGTAAGDLLEPPRDPDSSWY